MTWIVATTCMVVVGRLAQHCSVPVVLMFQLTVSVVCCLPPGAEIILFVGWGSFQMKPGCIQRLHRLSCFDAIVFMLQYRVALQRSQHPSPLLISACWIHESLPPKKRSIDIWPSSRYLKG